MSFDTASDKFMGDFSVYDRSQNIMFVKVEELAVKYLLGDGFIKLWQSIIKSPSKLTIKNIFNIIA